MDTSKTTRFPLGLLLTALLVSLFFLYMAIPKTWEEATKTADDGTITLADDWAGTIERKLSKYEKHDLYALLAVNDGYFECKHCPTGKFFLKKGELYRYGTTGDGQNGRGYNEEWIYINKLFYIHLLSGDLTTVSIAQASFIGAYALLPQNLARPLPNSSEARPYWYRLVIPPGNNSLD